MRQMKNKELLVALRSPWDWCLIEIKRRQLTSAYMSESTGVSRSTMRSLYNGRSTDPSYPHLTKILAFLLDTRGHKPVELPTHQNRGKLPVSDAP